MSVVEILEIFWEIFLHKIFESVWNLFGIFFLVLPKMPLIDFLRSRPIYYQDWTLKIGNSIVFTNIHRSKHIFYPTFISKFDWLSQHHFFAFFAFFCFFCFFVQIFFKIHIYYSICLQIGIPLGISTIMNLTPIQFLFPIWTGLWNVIFFPFFEFLFFFFISPTPIINIPPLI